MIVKKNTVYTQLIEYTESELDTIKDTLSSLPHNGEDEPYPLIFNLDNKPAIYTGLVSLLPTLIPDICIIDSDASQPGKLYEVDSGLLPHFTLRDYQISCVQKALYHKRGIVQIATGGGKTLCIVSIIAHLRREGLANTALVVVPTGFLMQQTASVFKSVELTTGEVGYGSKYQQGADIYIAVINSAYRACRDNWTPDWILNPDILIVDECQHLSASMYIHIATHCRAKYRYAFTATAFEDPRFYSSEDMHLIGLTGPIICNVKSKDLRVKGYLAEPLVTMLSYTSNKITTYNWQGVYRSGVVYNKARNDLICSTSVECYNLGNKVLVFISEIKHGHALAKQISEAGADCLFVHSKSAWLYSYGKHLHKNWSIQDIANYVNENDKAIVVSTSLFDEAIDLPTVNVLIMATAKKKYRRTVQRTGRGMRPKTGSNRVFIFDFQDNSHVYLKKQSEYRLWTYETEEFEISLSLDHTFEVMRDKEKP